MTYCSPRDNYRQVQGHEFIDRSQSSFIPTLHLFTPLWQAMEPKQDQLPAIEKNPTNYIPSSSVSTSLSRDRNDVDAEGPVIQRGPSSRIGNPLWSWFIHRTLRFSSTQVSGIVPGPPPDAGFQAWSQALLCHLAIFNTWGYINSFGIFQTYYTSALDHSPSDISWVGSMQIWLLFFIGTISGRITDAGFFRTVFIVGSLLQVIGVFMTSLATKYWQIFIAQGLCTGIGNGLVFCPSFAVLSGYFLRNRALAIGIAASGSATGGVIFPAIAENLLPSIGFPWTMRVIGFVMLPTMSLTVPFFKSRLPPRPTGPLVEWSAFKEPLYLLFTISMFLSFWGLYFAFYYVGKFAQDVLHVSEKTSINVLSVMNGVGLFGRLIPGFIADRYIGPLNAIIPFVLMSGVMMYYWAAITNLRDIYGFAIGYGFFAAGIQALLLATLSSLTADPKKAGVRMGMVLSVISFAALTGSPLGGALITLRGGGGSGRKYLFAQMFAASSFALGFAILLAARFAKVRWKIKVKV